MKKLLCLIFAFSSSVWACPDNQHGECIVPRLGGGGCAKRICVPTVRVTNPLKEVTEYLQNEAFSLAATAKSKGTEDYKDCIPVVTAGVAAAGAKIGTLGGPWGTVVGAALGAGGGVNMARIACRRMFPKSNGDEE